MFTKAIVKTPCRNIVKGITSAKPGQPDYLTALEQHKNYVNSLTKCGIEVIIMEADENYPDSVFIEDTALLTPFCAIIMRPGAKSRIGETESVAEFLKDHFDKIEAIAAPGTIEAGDIMKIGTHYYIGISERTNEAGADQLISILTKYGMSGSKVKLNNVLHLKTGLAYLENDNLVITGEFLNHEELKKFNQIKIDVDESYAANCIWVNDTVIIPAGFPKTKRAIEQAGYKTSEVDVSEFQKLDGGMSCLSLRF
jgi:dimethylargininase